MSLNIESYAMAKSYTDNQVFTINETINSVTSGVKNISNSGSQLVFTLGDDTQMSITLTGLSDENFTTVLKTKLDSLNSILLNKFTYVNSQLLFDGEPINGTLDLSDYYTQLQVNNLLNNKSNINHTHNKTDVGLDNIDNTSDINKPISIMTQNALDGKVDKVANKSLILDTEITRLSNLTNYDSTNVDNHVSNTDNPHNTSINNLLGINITSPIDNQIISYDLASSKWINKVGSTTDEKVKMNSVSDSRYLSELIDGISIQNIGGKLVVKALDGMNITLVELNRLSGLDKNIMDYLNAISNPMTVRAVVNTYADLSYITSPTDGNVAIVKADENNSNKQWTYIYVNSAWNPLTENNVTVRDFFVDKLDLASEVKNKLSQVNMDMTDIVKTTDLANYTDSVTLDTNYAKKSDLTGKANSSDVYTSTQADNLLNNKVDKVTGKSLITDTEITRLASINNYDHTEVDNHMDNNDIHVTLTDKTNLANVVANSHAHTNKTVLDKFTEVSGVPYYDGVTIGSGAGISTWNTFNL